MQLPRAFQVDVTESRGFLTGNCTYLRVKVGEYYFSVLVPINAGKPFYTIQRTGGAQKLITQLPRIFTNASAHHLREQTFYQNRKL